MNWIRWLRALLVAVIAAEAAAFTAGGPRWRVKCGPDAALAGFTADWASIVTVERGSPCRIVTWDARTAASRAVPLGGPPGNDDWFRAVRLTGGGRFVLIDSVRGWARFRLDPDGGTWRLFDATTGDRVAGLIPNIADAPPEPGSPDGRWLACEQPYRSMPGRQLDVHAVPGLTPVVRFEDRESEWPDKLVFADAADRAAVLWHPYGKTPATDAVELVELPSGRPVRRFDLPAGHHWSLVNWRGNRLTVAARPQWRYRVVVVFDLQADPPRQLLRYELPPDVVALRTGPGWVAAVVAEPRPLTPLDRGLTTLCERANIPTVVPGREARVTRFDAGGRPDAGMVVPGVVSGDNIHVSPDGRTMASLDQDDRLAVWDLTPPVPWPRAALAGSIAAVGWAWLERRGARR